MSKKFFPALDSQKSINQTELEILDFWKQNQVFQDSVDQRSPLNPFVFFDGPPFATGTPHYGHILAGTIKDAIPRYQTMKGKRVERKFGWDCHGLPVEYQVEKEHEIGGKPGIEAMGVGKFNELCRSIVLRCRDEWETTVERMGRFVDFQDDYKTMDSNFMESVWSVFARLWDKGLIYEGEKVIAYSPKLGSPLSNFEAGLNYKDIDDPAVTVRFEVLDETVEKPVKTKKTYFLAWTTTPWTLPSNVALGFGKNHQYVLVEHEGAYYWLAEEAATKHFPEDFEILARKLGHEFLGVRYRPLFDFFADENVTPPNSLLAQEGEPPKRFVCLHDEGNYVTTDSGTGIVHFSPSFGAEDAELCAKFDVFGVNPIDENGYFTKDTPPLEGLYFRADSEVKGSEETNANTWVIAALKESGALFKREQIRHQYPFCWRTDCALMYRGVKTWFVKVSAIKDRMIELNQNVNWTPDHLKDGRFGKMLASAPDWAISRNRFWGTPLPVWRCDKTGEIEVIGSRAELEAKVGKPVEDLHKHFVDDLTWENPKTGGTMRRIEEVLDCWFESGSMPYGSRQFKFERDADSSSENQALFQSAHFISEGMDQTRGWFYSLHVLGVALLDTNIYQKVTCSGIVLAEDGEKMSKSKKNYPDPNLIFEKYGADAMRFYLLQSPVATKGENLKFMEREVEEVLKTVILPLRNAYHFLSMYANIDGWTPTKLSLIRHGEAEHNVARVYSGKAENPHHLTRLGQDQAQKAAEKLANIDQLIVSPFVRTQETAQIIAKAQGLEKIETEERFCEIDFGSLEGKNYIGLEQRLSEPTTEKLSSIQSRMLEGITDWVSKNPGNHLGIVSHGGSIRSAFSALHGCNDNQSHLGCPSVETGGVQLLFVPPESENELDQWILSELATLVTDFNKAFEKYDTEKACRLIPPFVDKLNNWYLRQNRKRFWRGGLDADKKTGYQTLHYCLWTISKVLAPICPFFADWLYQSVTGQDKLSVHLDFIPIAVKAHQQPSLENQINVTREVVRLAGSIRSRQKIKLRQPLPKLQFALSQELKLDLDVIASEANVKQVELLTDVSGVAQEIIKVDARKVGKKFGSKVQELIKAGKTGKFTYGENGQVMVIGEILEFGEYERAFVTEAGQEADSSPEAVVILETELTPELEREGEAREIIRAIQELRKKQGFEVSDRIVVTYATEDADLQTTFSQFSEIMAGEVLADLIEVGNAEILVIIDEKPLKLTLKKV